MKSYILDISPRSQTVYIPVSQYDAGTYKLRFILMDGRDLYEIPAGYTPWIYGKKADGKGFSYPAAEVVGSVVSFDVTEQMTAAFGRVDCEVVIQGDDDETLRRGSVNICLDVEKSPVQREDIKNADDYENLKEAVQAAKAAAEEAEAAAEEAVTAAGEIGATVEETASGAVITVTDGKGQTTTAEIHNGQNGVDGSAGPAGPAGERGPQGETGPAGPAGADGSDYVLTASDKAEIAGMAAQEVEPKIPTVTISETETGAEVTITDGTGQTTTAEILNGRDGSTGPQGEIGPQGPAGKDGRDGSDGVDGSDGQDGLSAYEIAKAHGYEGSTDPDDYKKIVGSTLRGADVDAIRAKIAAGEAFAPTMNTFRIYSGDTVIIAPSSVKAGDVVIVGNVMQVETTGTGKVTAVYMDTADPNAQPVVFAATGSMDKDDIVDAADFPALRTEAGWISTLKGADGAAGADGQSAAETAQAAGWFDIPATICYLYGLDDSLTAEAARKMVKEETAFEGIENITDVNPGQFCILTADQDDLPAGAVYVMGYCKGRDIDAQTMTFDPAALWIVDAVKAATTPEELSVRDALFLASLAKRAMEMLPDADSAAY